MGKSHIPIPVQTKITEGNMLSRVWHQFFNKIFATTEKRLQNSGIVIVSFPIDLASIADGDILTSFTPGFNFKILSFDFFTNIPVTTGAKESTINLEIGTTNVAGGVISLTSAACTPIGKKVEGTTITSSNSGADTDTISIEASSTTAFVEGSGVFLLKLENTDATGA